MYWIHILIVYQQKKLMFKVGSYSSYVITDSILKFKRLGWPGYSVIKHHTVSDGGIYGQKIK